MRNAVLGLAVMASLMTGCASVKMESKELDAAAKEFNAPSEGNAGLYIFRDSNLGGALKKDIWVDGECIGESAPKVFFHTEVVGGQEHKLETESEFSANEFTLLTEKGRNYFIRQYIKMGVFVGGANFEKVEEEEGKKIVSGLDLAVKGSCSK